MIDETFIQQVNDYCDRYDIQSFKIDKQDDENLLTFKLKFIYINYLIEKMKLAFS
jgi:hypothetical protein